ncbi:hypothetical protein [Clostridium grantii]|uniref:Uncharacterized protein n=1 Tax=Clostridium grantii DSM 8605 TaxID=1121316 RepID=A0A1M5RCB8_9CLOT|nr:hypothetical protein [Clostridium grantii]SHH23689.1 hypothetical protein SAMN02745207_00439 [Clostridium grantii DSM 8605]
MEYLKELVINVFQGKNQYIVEQNNYYGMLVSYNRREAKVGIVLIETTFSFKNVGI